MAPWDGAGVQKKKKAKTKDNGKREGTGHVRWRGCEDKNKDAGFPIRSPIKNIGDDKKGKRCEERGGYEDKGAGVPGSVWISSALSVISLAKAWKSRRAS